MAKAVAKKNKTEVGEVTPDLFAADAGEGVTNLGSEDLAIPFLKILQKMSPELDELDNAKAGDIYNTVTKEVVKGKDGVRVINCAYTLQYIEWEPRGTGTGAPHRIYAADEDIPTTERGEDNKDYVVDGSGRYLERTAQHYVLIIDEDDLTQQALLPMKATQFKKSKQWNSSIKSSKMKDGNGNLFIPARYSHVWHLTSVGEENKNGSWHGWFIDKEGPIEDVNFYREAKLFHDSIAAGQVKVKHVREEEAPSSNEDTPF